MSVPDLTSAYVHRPLGKKRRNSLTPHLSLASLIVKISWSRATHALGSAIRWGFRMVATHVGILQALLDRSDDIPRQNIIPRSLFVHCVLYRHYPLTRRLRLKYVCICCAHCGGTDAVLYSTPSTSYSRKTLIFSSSNCYFFVIGHVRADDSFAQVDSGQRFGNFMFGAACGAETIGNLSGQYYGHSGAVHS